MEIPRTAVPTATVHQMASQHRRKNRMENPQTAILTVTEHRMVSQHRRKNRTEIPRTAIQHLTVMILNRKTSILMTWQLVTL